MSNKVISIVLVMVMFLSLSTMAIGTQNPIVGGNNTVWDSKSRFNVTLTEDDTNVYASFSITGSAVFSAVQLGLSVDSLRVLPYDATTGNTIADNGSTVGTIKDKDTFIPVDWNMSGTYRQSEFNDYSVKLVCPDTAKNLVVSSGTTQVLFTSVFKKQAGYIDLANSGLNWYGASVGTSSDRATRIVTADNIAISNLETEPYNAPLDTSYVWTYSEKVTEKSDVSLDLLTVTPTPYILQPNISSTLTTSTTLPMLNFDTSTAMPSGWTSTSVTTNGTAAVWSVTANPQTPSCTAYSSSNCIMFNSADAANGNTSRLQMTAGNGIEVPSDKCLTVSFYMYHDSSFSSNSDNVQLQYSTDGGTTWSNFGTSISRYNGSSAWTQHNFKLIGITGSEVLIGLLGKSTYGANMFLDNISINTVIADVVPLGTGTLADPYLISSIGNILWMTNNNDLKSGYSGKYFKQTADIKISGDWLPIGGNNYKFFGTYDGDGHTISDLNMPSTNLANNKGLFGYTGSSSIIKNLAVVVNIDNSNANYIGGLVGYNYGKITNCKSSGTVSNSYKTYNAYKGGLVGYNDSSGVISQSSSSCSVIDATTSNSYSNYSGGLVGYNYGTLSNCFATGAVSNINSSSYTGGLIAYSNNLITNCYATGTVNGYNYVGGLVGYNYSTITNCFAKGAVSGTNYKGGLVGYNISSIIRCYYVDANGTNGIGYNSGSVKYCTQQTDLNFYKTLATYTTLANWNEQYPWDCTTIWSVNNDFPSLTAPVPPPTPTPVPTPTPIPTPTPTPTPTPGPSALPVVTPISVTYDAVISQWVLDEANNNIYAITNTNKMFFINATTLQKTNEIALSASPSDIDISNGKVYVSLPSINKIWQIDIATQVVDKTLSTTSDPYRIAIDGDKLFYTEYDQWCDTYVYELSTDTQKIVCSSMYYPDLAVDTEKHVLFIGESSSSGCDVKSYSTSTYSYLTTSSYDSGYGFGNASRKVVYDSNKIYYAGRCLDANNLANIDGAYGETIICAKDNYVVSGTSIYDRDSFAKLSSLPTAQSLALIDSGNNLLLFNATTNSVVKQAITNIIAPTPTPNYSYGDNKIALDKTLTKWVFDSTTNFIYAISSQTNKLLYINADTMKVDGEKIIGSNPSDIALSNGKLYVSLLGATKIAVTGTTPQSAIESIYVSTNPYHLAIDGNKLFYSESDQWCSLFVYDISAKTNTKIGGSYYVPYLAVDSARHILYFGEVGGISSSSFIAMDTSSYSIISSYSYGSYANGMVITDGNSAYFAGRRFSPTNLANILGNYGANVIAAGGKYAVTSNKIYNNDTYTAFATMPYTMSLALIGNNDNLFTFNSAGNVIQKYNSIAPKPVSINVTGLTDLNVSKLKDVIATYTILGKDQYLNDLVNPAVEWTITDKEGNIPTDISISDKGILTIKASAIAGNYTLKAVVATDPTVKCELAITLNAPISINSVSLDKTSTVIPIAGTDTLTANILPSNADQKDVTWSSDNDAVAIVNNGVVTAISPGKAVITVKTVDGEFTASCEVLVPKAITGVAFENSNLTITKGDKKILKVNIIPDEAWNHSVIWSSSDQSVVRIEDGYVVGLKTGTATITVTTVDGGFTATCTVTVVNPDMSKQNFDSNVSIPGGWESTTVETKTGDIAKWSIVNNSSFAPNSLPNSAMFNSYQAGIGNSARLNMSASDGIYIADASKASISFYVYHDNSYFSCTDRIQLQYLINNYTDQPKWENIGEPILRYSTTTGWEKHTIELTGIPNGVVMLGLLGISDNGGNIYIDDIVITGSDKISDNAIVMTDASALNINYASGDSNDWVTQNIILSTVGANQSTISWVSNNSNAISNSGKVVQGSEDVTVVLTATIAKGSETTTKQFRLVVKGLNDQYYVHSTANKLELAFAPGDNSAKVTRDITLKSSADNGTTISWVSSDTKYITIGNGVATVTSDALKDKTVTLTATITKGALNEIKKFDVVVKALAKVVAGRNHIVALSGDGTVWAWGQNEYGQLGLGYTSVNYQSTPCHVSGLKNIVDVVANRDLTAALDESGRIWIWGSCMKYSSYPTPFIAEGPKNVISIAVYQYSILALTADGMLWSFDGNQFSAMLTISNAVSISSGGYSVAILKNDGTVWMLGDNSYGQLGNGTTYGGSNVPVQVMGLTDIKKISSGYYHVLALKNDGTVWGWGYNGSGQLGNGNNEFISSPTLMPTISNVSTICAGESSSYALDNDGFVWEWCGYKGYSAKKLTTISDIVGLACQSDNLISIKNDGTVWQNDYNPQKIIGIVLAEPNTNISATKIQIDKTSLVLSEQSTAVLTATIIPQNTTDVIVWSSNNTAVATVENGKVTAVGVGTAIIKVQVGQLTAECTVTVTNITQIDTMPYLISATLSGGSYLKANINMQPNSNGTDFSGVDFNGVKYIVVMLQKGNTPVLVDSIMVTNSTMNLERAYNFTGDNYRMSISLLDSFQMDSTNFNGFGQILAKPVEVQVEN